MIECSTYKYFIYVFTVGEITYSFSTFHVLKLAVFIKYLLISNIIFSLFKVYLHPTSVNQGVTFYPSPYMVYQEKIKTSKVFIRECTIVPVLALVLFSAGTLKVELNCGQFVISIDEGWIMFSVESNEVRILRTISAFVEPLHT